MKKNKKLFISVVIISILILATILVGIFAGWETAKLPWTFLSDEVLGMKWVNKLIGSLVVAIGGTYAEGSIGYIVESSIQFFIYDFIKIGVLLCLLIFVISYIQSYFPPERTKQILRKFHGVGANSVGALLGTITPFCSCSSIPLFIGFTRAGISSGVTFSFLISSPLVDLGSLVLLTSIFGFPIAIAYVIVGLILAIVGGTIIEKTGLGNNIEGFVTNKTSAIVDIEVPELTNKERLIYAKENMLETYKKVFWYIIIGVGIGAAIHNVIPKEWIEAVLGNNNPFAVIIATLIGTPMYADIFGTIPVAEALYSSGVGVGTILAFMMSVTALSLPSMIMLRKVLKPKLLVSFISIVVLGIIIVGYAFNALQFLFV